METLRLQLASARQRFARWYNSIYFFPSLLIVGAFVLFVISSALDTTGAVIVAPPAAPLGRSLVFTGTPSAARSILASIATAFAQIMGVVFSVTLVAVQLTASSYTPQVLSEFEKNKVNQVVLGAFAGLVTYALLVLKTIRTGETGEELYGAVLGTNLALVWAIIDLLLLVLYIANLISFIRPHRFVEGIATAAIGAVDVLLAPRLLPWLEPGSAEDEARARAEQPSGVERQDGFPRRVVRAPADGVVVRLDWDGLLGAMQREIYRCQRICPGEPGLPWRLRMETKVGDSVTQGDLLAVVQAPTEGGNLELLANWVLLAFNIEDERRPEEDSAYGIALLGAMGTRAASGSATQVTIEVIRGLFAMLSKILSVPNPATYLVGEAAGVRLIVQRAPVDLFENAVAALSQVIDAALETQLSAAIEELGTRSTTLFLRLGREQPVETLRRLADAFYPLYRRALLLVQEPRAVQSLVDQFVKLVKTLEQEDLDPQADLTRAMLLRLRQAVRTRPVASDCLRRALAELPAPRMAMPTAGGPPAQARV